MPWSNDLSARTQRLPKDWHAKRAATYRAAQGRCQWVENGQRCTIVTPLNKTGDVPGGHADHLDRALGEDGPRQWLCPPHHAIKSSREGQDAMRTLRSKAKHPIEQHPGMTLPR